LPGKYSAVGGRTDQTASHAWRSGTKQHALLACIDLRCTAPGLRSAEARPERRGSAHMALDMAKCCQRRHAVVGRRSRDPAEPGRHDERDGSRKPATERAEVPLMQRRSKHNIKTKKTNTISTSATPGVASASQQPSLRPTAGREPRLVCEVCVIDCDPTLPGCVPATSACAEAGQGHRPRGQELESSGCRCVSTLPRTQPGYIAARWADAPHIGTRALARRG